MGLRVPDDVAVAGHMDLPFAPILIPPLTSVAQRVYDLGRLGAEILLQKLAWRDDQPWTAQTITLEPQLVVRASCGPAHSVAAALG